MKVNNLDEVSGELKKSNKSFLIITSILRKMKFPTEMRVTNFPEFPKFPKFPTEFRVSNFPKFPAFPKEIRVSNPTDLTNLTTEIGTVKKAIENLKLDPQINVSTPAPVIVPPASVSVTQREINPEKLAQAIADVIPSIDYKKLADAIAEEMGRMTIKGGGGSGGGNPFKTADGRPGRALIDDKGRIITSPDYFLSDKDTSGSVKYTGNLALNGRWYMFKVDGDAIRYASSSNNPNIPYTQAWTDRATLTYDYADHVDF